MYTYPVLPTRSTPPITHAHKMNNMVIYHQIYFADIVTVSDGGRFVRAFNPTAGHILWEKCITDTSKLQLVCLKFK